jgi:Asp-tRNA(Asn)/Glu-tRNA(Gln) amidotransferase B subunit
MCWHERVCGQGYQITQQASPIVSQGIVSLQDVLGLPEPKHVRINRIQLEIVRQGMSSARINVRCFGTDPFTPILTCPSVTEVCLSLVADRSSPFTRSCLPQDSGKNMHDVHPTLTFVDLNRAGMPLLEIVSEPDMRSTDEVLAYVRKLSGLLRHINVCQADMSKSQMRVDLNISVRPRLTHPEFAAINSRVGGSRDAQGRGLGDRVEVKNLNSFRAMLAAMNHEFQRQVLYCES